MKKRIAILIAIMMIATMMPITAFAAKETRGVCTIGKTAYTSVEAAINAVKNGQTITLLDNVESIGVDAKDKMFTIDLNTKTVGAANVRGTGIVIGEVGALRLVNGQVIGDRETGTIDLAKGILIIEDVCSINGNSSQGYAVNNIEGTVRIISGEFTAHADSGSNAIYTGSKAKTTLDVGSITDPKKWETAKSFAATVDSTPDVILDGVTYADTDRAMEAVKSGSTMVVQNDISWFSIDTGDADFTLDLNGKTIGSTSNGSCLYVDFSGTVKIVNGNIITGDTDWGALWILSGKVVLEDVKVTNTDIDQTAVLNEGGELEIISGTFTSSSKNYSAVTTETTAATSLGSHTVSNVSWADAKEFTAIDLKSKKITLSQDKYTYDGTAKRPEVTVEGVDPAYYNVTYKNNINAGTATVVVSGKYNSSASITKTFTIEPVAITETALAETTYKYNGSEKMPAVTVKAGASTVASGITADTADVDVTYAAGRKNAGTYEVTVTGKGNYTGTITKSFTIEPATITEASLSATALTFNNKARKPYVTVKAGSLKAATKISADTANIDLTYSSGRKNVGKYTITIKGKGNYTGTIKKTFKINPKGVAISKLSKGKKSFTVKWKKPTKTYRNQITGYQIRYSTSSKMSNAKIVKVKSKTATTKTIKKLKAKKKYYVQVRTYRVKNGVTYTSAWSTKKYIKTK